MEINKKIRRLADDLLRSRFEITKEIITHSSSNADIILMNLPVVGNIKILVVYREKEIKKQIKSVTCDFLRSYDDADDPCILIKGGWFGSHICGEGIITLNSMGYDLTDKVQLKKIKKEKDKIKSEYERLLQEKPSLFDPSKVLNKKELIEKYGEKDGMMIFNGEILMEDYLNKKLLIDKYGKKHGIMIFNGELSEQDHNQALYKKELVDEYGEKDGMMIFNGEISKKDYLNKKRLIDHYGEEFGIPVFEKKLINGMTEEMMEEVLGKANFIYSQQYYYGKPFNRMVTFKKGKIESDEKLQKNIWLDMPKEVLIASWGEPKDQKEEVTKEKTKLKLYFGSRVTRQKTVKYKHEVRLENNLVVGWKDLE